MTIDKTTYTNITTDGEEICKVPLLTAEEKSRAVEDYCISIESDCNKCPIFKYIKHFNENCYTLDSKKFPCDIDRNYELVFGKPEINFVKVERNDEVERMTYKEAIEILQEEHDYCQEMSYVIKALEMAIEALEKRIAKKPRETRCTLVCSSCGHKITEKGCKKLNRLYCKKCGQAIDWEDHE